MAQIVDSRCVLAVRNLKESTQFYIDILGFRRDPIEATGWSFLTRDNFKIMLGECPQEKPASELGDHSYFVHLMVVGLDQLHRELSARGAREISEPENKPWGLREFGIRTPDGHRITFAEPVPAG